MLTYALASYFSIEINQIQQVYVQLNT